MPELASAAIKCAAGIKFLGVKTLFLLVPAPHASLRKQGGNCKGKRASCNAAAHCCAFYLTLL
jgi:hypothetical protein